MSVSVCVLSTFIYGWYKYNMYGHVFSELGDTNP